MPTAVLDNPFLEQLPTANTRPAGDFPEDTFVTFKNVPVFAEHETVDKKGRRLKFGRDELASVANRGNRRIDETGDYAAVTLGHTPSPEAVESGTPMPPIVGFAGPFRLGRIGDGPRARHAILADLHIFQEDLPKVRKHPRRSPELWLEDRYEEMFLDPIALLGAEAPRLDLGLLYSARRHGRHIEKYAAAAPSPANVFIPNDDNRRYEAAQKEAAMPLTPDDVRQIVDAFEQLDWVQWVRQQMEAGEGENQLDAGMDEDIEPAGDGADAGGIEPPAPDAAPAGPPAAVPPPANGGPPALPEAPPEDEEPERMAAMARKYAAADEMDDDEFEKYCSYRKSRYQAGSVDPDNPGPKGQGTNDDIDGSAAGSYSEKAKFSRLSRELSSLKTQFDRQGKLLNLERSKRIDAERYQALVELRHQGFLIEPDDELERCRYSKMNDEQFQAELEFIARAVQRVPGHELYVPQSGPSTTDGPYKPGSGAARERYSKDLADRAFKLCEAKRIRGEDVSYEEELEKLRNGAPA